MTFWEQLVSAMIGDVIVLTFGYLLGFRIVRRNDK